MNNNKLKYCSHKYNYTECSENTESIEKRYIAHARPLRSIL